MNTQQLLLTALIARMKVLERSSETQGAYCIVVRTVKRTLASCEDRATRRFLSEPYRGPLEILPSSKQTTGEKIAYAIQEAFVHPRVEKELCFNNEMQPSVVQAIEAALAHFPYIKVSFRQLPERTFLSVVAFPNLDTPV